MSWWHVPPASGKVQENEEETRGHRCNMAIRNSFFCFFLGGEEVFFGRSNKVAENYNYWLLMLRNLTSF